MFESDFLDRASRVHPATPFLFYIPLATAFGAWALYSGTTSWNQAALFFPLGVLVWQLFEYTFHRFFLHWEGSGPFTRRLHEIVHGYHHKYPDDGDRLVFPLGGSIPLAIIVGTPLWLLQRPAATIPLFVGIVAGYLVYDFIHYSTHHFKPRTEWGKALRAHHMAHHFACPDKNFGISHRWADSLLGTLRRRDERQEEPGAAGS